MVQKISNLETQLESVRRSISPRNTLNVPGDPSVIKVELNETVSERYSIVKVVHNATGPNRFPRGVLFGSSHPDNDLDDFLPGIALSQGNDGDHITVKIAGPSFALTVPSGDVYGVDPQIKAGAKLKVDSTPGQLELGDDSSTNYFTSIESRHAGESVLRVNFAIPDNNQSNQNRLFVVGVTSLFGGQTYFGDRYEEDSNGVFQIVESGITIVAIDDTAMTGVLTPGLKYLARRTNNLGSGGSPFYFYHIQPTRVE